MVKERQSNIELLRIVAMLLVMIIHANYWRIGVPTHAEAIASPVPTFTRILIQHLASPCVDVFIIISGYFAIRPKLKSICNLWFLLAFWGGVSVMSDVFVYHRAFTIHSLFNVVLPFFGWFIPAYLGLYLLAPILNQYAEHEDDRWFGWYLLLFFALQFVFDLMYQGWTINGQTPYGISIFNRGYSILSFIPLYLLGRFLMLHRPTWMTKSFRRWIIAYGGVFVVSAAASLLLLRGLSPNGWAGTLVKHVMKDIPCYTSPVCLLGSLFLFLAFDALSFSNRFVNHVAISVFGVFCFHSMSFYAPVVKSIYANHNGVGVLLMDAAFIVAVYTAGTLIDQVRIFSWKAISKYVFR